MNSRPVLHRRAHRRGTPRRRLASATGLAALLGAAALAGVTYAALGGFSATVTNNANSATSGTLLLAENDSATTCLSTAHATAISANSQDCAINLYAGLTNAVPGGTVGTATVTVKNFGDVNAGGFTLTPGSTCSVASAGYTSGGVTYTGSDTTGFCGEVDVTIENATTGVCVYPAPASGATTTTCPAPSASYTLSDLASNGAITLPPLAAGASATYTVSLQLSSAATNADQGLAASLPLAWELTQ